jgi:hypothetical protein
MGMKRRRRNYDDDYEDDYDDRAERKKKPAGGLPTWAWIVGGSAVGVLLLGLIGILIIVSVSSGRRAGQTAKAQLPDDMTLAAYLVQRPDKPTRITVVCNLDDYYNFAYSNSASTHYGMRIKQDSPYASDHAWVLKESEAGRAVFEALKDGTEHTLTLAMVWQGPDGTRTPPGKQGIAIVKVMK